MNIEQRNNNTLKFYIIQEIEVEVELTANHHGRFEMFLCPNNDPSLEATQECFDKYPLMISGTREHRYYIPSESKKKGNFRLVPPQPSIIA